MMALACQENSYCKEFQTSVRSCTPAELSLPGKTKEKLQGYEVVLEDTILFPEGGGQPDDRGTINDIEVLRITRRGADAINFVTKEIQAGTEVCLKVDWKRRFDHMQQHTGQHLITAIAESMYGCPTTSWNLGENISSIELDIPSLTDQQMADMETAVNEKILACVPITPHLYHDKDDPELQKFRCRGLPDDHIGPVRVLEINGIDSCLCCGTHVSNLSHIQMIKLLWTEKAKKKGRTNLMFVAGGRVLQYLGRSVKVERSLTTLLKGPVEDHYERAETAVKGFKSTQKYVTSLLRDLAVFEGQKFKSNGNPLLCLHRKEGDLEFMNIIIQQVDNCNKICFLTVGEEKGAGLFLLSGPEDFIQNVGPKVAEILNGKGSINRGNYQGKANKLSQKGKAEKLIQEYLSSKDNSVKCDDRSAEDKEP
ncbi:alanyl-tRNA editing protein Aarsd1-like isoform X2 [Ostrea edulis]|uniref:alanyl-tRNA editing protein Aarsd1-like isoform X2 n=1 Tax=Ostrea edulis TaxID=37623 RepID=UPI0024AFE9FA|nr:alanyl-tRNA editing protein Aarsd1-like isoform X2 [Ostrea edulis]